MSDMTTHIFTEIPARTRLTTGIHALRKLQCLNLLLARLHLSHYSDSPGTFCLASRAAKGKQDADTLKTKCCCVTSFWGNKHFNSLQQRKYTRRATKQSRMLRCSFCYTSFFFLPLPTHRCLVFLLSLSFPRCFRFSMGSLAFPHLSSFSLVFFCSCFAGRDAAG